MDFNFFEFHHPSQPFYSQSQTPLDVQSQTPVESENQRKTRNLNYSVEEDTSLVCAWLTMFKDILVGGDQKNTNAF